MIDSTVSQIVSPVTDYYVGFYQVKTYALEGNTRDLEGEGSRVEKTTYLNLCITVSVRSARHNLNAAFKNAFYNRLIIG